MIIIALFLPEHMIIGIGKRGTQGGNSERTRASNMIKVHNLLNKTLNQARNASINLHYSILLYICYGFFGQNCQLKDVPENYYYYFGLKLCRAIRYC